MEIIKREHCVVTGSTELEQLYTFKDFPVNQNTTLKASDTDIKLDLIFDICKKSGMIQVRNLVPEDVLYNSEHSRSIGGIWRNHHQRFALFLQKYNPQRVFEIGGGRGFLEVAYNEKRQKPSAWTILEPNPDPAEGCCAKFEIGFFDSCYEIRSTFDTIVFSHLFEHIYEPDCFMNSLRSKMPIGSHLIFSVPDMASMLKNRQTNTLNFEHTFYLSEPYVDYLLTSHGFRILEKEYYQEHSIFYSSIRENGVTSISLDNTLYARNKKKFDNFIKDYEDFVKTVNQRMNTAKSNETPVYLFGAHLFSQFLLAFGLNEKKITAILDNDVKKHGKRLQGCDLVCQSPKILKNISKPIVILRAGTYQKEIKQDIIENINADTVFWE